MCWFEIPFGKSTPLLETDKRLDLCVCPLHPGRLRPFVLSRNSWRTLEQKDIQTHGAILASRPRNWLSLACFVHIYLGQVASIAHPRISFWLTALWSSAPDLHCQLFITNTNHLSVVQHRSGLFQHGTICDHEWILQW